MSNFDQPSKSTVIKKPSSGYSKEKDIIDAPGKVTATLGSGENAKNSIIFLTIKYAFIIGAVLSVLIVVNYWCFSDKAKKVPDFTGDIKMIWEIVIPIITLSLGYAFGKSQK